MMGPELGGLNGVAHSLTWFECPHLTLSYLLDYKISSLRVRESERARERERERERWK